jgi:NADH:ubiquinone oxidoreductase subunit 5 (subunit L)/multisubunit Na+/H+ antiporter MnhA subunit
MKYFFLRGYSALIIRLIALLLRLTFYKRSALIIRQSVASKKINIFWILDFEAVLFFSLLCLIVGSVYTFAEHYMEKDYQVLRFFWILTSFVLSMGLLIFIPDFLFLLIGWDGLGITRFLLIAYYVSSNS